MMDPRYQEIKSSQIPEFQLENGTQIKIICGRINNTQGPVRDIVIDPEYLDIRVPSNSLYEHPTKPGHTVFAYVIDGKGYFCQEKKPFTFDVVGESYFDMNNEPFIENETLVLFEDGESVRVSTEDEPVRFLLISGKPINEPVAWRGPIVMNTQEELRRAFEEYQKGTFIKHKDP
jgi:hypothetical protein